MVLFSVHTERSGLLCPGFEIFVFQISDHNRIRTYLNVTVEYISEIAASSSSSDVKSFT